MGNDYYETCRKLIKEGHYIKAIPMVKELVSWDPSAANYRLLAEAYEGAGNYPKAVEAYRKEAAIYRKKGDVNAAIIEEGKANALDVEFNIYYTKPVNKVEKLNLAKGEPERGCYIGAYIEDDRRISGNFEKFNKYTGKNHSTFYAYLKYGEPFPSTWCNEIKRLGAIPHIAWEPDGLDTVQDDDYSQKFAEEAAKIDWPIFLRFASEMNGDWTPYNGNPSLYKEKFRLVHDIFEKRAPKVIMLWTPNSIPQSNIKDYYPGDDCVDWVGVNIYSVHHHGSDLSHSAEHEDPTYLLEYVYNLYGRKKPLHISEFAGTHFCKACGKHVKDFGISRMYQMYSSIATKFPRVKCIDWFDCDTINETGYEVSSPNDYSLTDDLQFLNAYRKLIALDWFLGNLNSDGTPNLPSYSFSLMTEKTVLSGKVIISSFIRSYLKKPQVIYYIDGVKVESSVPPFYMEIDGKKFKKGLHTLKAELKGDGRGVIATRKFQFVIKEGNFSVSLPYINDIKEELSIEPGGSKFLWHEKWGGWHGGGGEVALYTPVPVEESAAPEIIESPSLIPSATPEMVLTGLTSPVPTAVIIENPLIPVSSKTPADWSKWKGYITDSYRVSKNFIMKNFKKEWILPAAVIIILIIIITIIVRSKFFRKYWFVLCYVLKNWGKKDT
jgi:tetratricopeptide (TPR) repeat protein